MTGEQLQLVQDLIALARIEMHVRIIRAIGDVMHLNGYDDFSVNALLGAADAIEGSLQDMAQRQRKPLGMKAQP